LAQAYGWSAPFIALLVFAAGIILPATLLLVKETQQYKTLKRLSPAEAATIKEAPQLLSNPPRFGSPWAPLVAVCDKRVVLHLVQSTVGFACMLSAQVELPGQLAAPPYRLSPSMIGVAMIATGGAGMIASPLGGKLFDRGADKCSQPMFRLTVNNLASLIGEFCRGVGLHRYVAICIKPSQRLPARGCQPEAVILSLFKASLPAALVGCCSVALLAVVLPWAELSWLRAHQSRQRCMHVDGPRA